MIDRIIIEDLTYPIVELYMTCENRLLKSIIRRAKRGADLTGERLEWDLNKLRDMGGLTKGAIEEISRTSKKAREQLPKILLQIAKESIEGEASAGVFRVVQALQEQAVSDLNVVNTTMLAGVQDVFGNFINMLEHERNKALGNATMELMLGRSTFQESVGHAIKEMARNGVTAFQDKAGRNWSPEGYVSMDLRTTSANVSRQAEIAQANDFGMHVFQVSTHAGARPLCAPYQGRFYSDDGSSGQITDADGNTYDYEPIENTSYGEPAGLFGINCGHDRIYVSDGFYNRRKPLTGKELEENRKQYEQSQQQRALERKIRMYRRESGLLDEAGLKASGEATKGLLNRAVSEYETFCEDVGRAPRWDRTKIY